MCIREDRQSGRPDEKYTHRTHESRSMPEAILDTNEKIDNAGGPLQAQGAFSFHEQREDIYAIEVKSPPMRGRHYKDLSSRHTCITCDELAD